MFFIFLAVCLNGVQCTVGLEDMLVDEIGVEDAGSVVNGWRGGYYDVLSFFVLQDQTH